jgi:hypothetical protein
MGGLSKLNLGKCASQESKKKGEEIHMGSHIIFRHSIFGKNIEEIVEKKSLELEQPWRANSRACWGIFGVTWSDILKS